MLQSHVPAGTNVSQLPTAGDPTLGFGIAGIQVTAVLPFDFESEVKKPSSSDDPDINGAFKRALQKLDEEEFDELDEEARRINEAQSEVPASSAHESLHSIRRLLSKAIRSLQTAKETTKRCIAIHDREEGVD